MKWWLLAGSLLVLPACDDAPSGADPVDGAVADSAVGQHDSEPPADGSVSDAAANDGAIADGARPDAAERDASAVDQGPADGALADQGADGAVVFDGSAADAAPLDPDAAPLEPDAAPPEPDAAPPPPPASIRINEFLARNVTTNRDLDDEFSDWIELYNFGDEAVLLEGYSLTDDGQTPDKWVFPAGVALPAGGYLLVWASNKDRVEGELHTNFKLGGGGEFLGLFDDLGRPLDGIDPFPAQAVDVSYGRGEDDQWTALRPPTPGEDNSAFGLGVTLSRPGGVFVGAIEVTARAPEGATVHYTVDGSQPTNLSPQAEGAIRIEATTWLRVLAVAEFGAWTTEARFLEAEAGLADVNSRLPLVVVSLRGPVPDQGMAGATAHIVVPEAGVSRLTAAAELDSHAGIRVRGDSSREYPKKQFALEFRDARGRDAKREPLGLPAAADWILNAPYSDKTLMRNALMYRWSNAIGRWAPRAKFVELWLDSDGVLDAGDYAGVYVLMDRVERGGARVNLRNLRPRDVDAPGITGGYLMKKDTREGRLPADLLTTAIYSDTLILEDPGAGSITPLQRDWLAEWLGAFEGALSGDGFAGPDGYAQFIDVGSFIDHHLLSELGRNPDAFVRSTWLYKDRGALLNMGPIWDFDGALGNASNLDAWLPEGWHTEAAGFPEVNANGYAWYLRLFEDPAFRAAYAARWTELRRGPLSTETMLADIDAAAALLQEAAGRNFVRWPVLGEQIWPNPDGWAERDTFALQIDALKAWVTARAAWMDGAVAAHP